MRLDFASFALFREEKKQFYSGLRPYETVESTGVAAERRCLWLSMICQAAANYFACA
jgi:hypothetical protein